MRTTILRYATLALMMGLVPAADAVVVELSAEARSLVQSFVDGAEDSFDEDIATFGLESGLDLPIATQAKLETLVQEGDPQASGLAFADFDDPTRDTSGRNPEELAVEADCFSNLESTSYEISSFVVEERVVRLSAEELGNPVDGRRTVRSSFFLSGAMFVWSFEAGRDLTGLSAEVTFKVRRFTRGDDGTESDSTILLDKSVSIHGGPDGSVTHQASPDVTTFSGDLSILPPIPGLPLGDVSMLEVAQLAIIPDGQEVEYEYQAAVDEKFILEATVTVVVSNLPQQTGVAAVIGRPFTAVEELLTIGIAPSSAKAIQARLNQAIVDFHPETPSAPPTVSFPATCGMLGFEMLPMLLLSLALFSAPRSRIARRVPPDQQP